ncbi:unnamed protein product [Moneuplotes crassus]|uniref:Uncharacterized protein n=1 Tax=Euplotes crassus TaxID=5936 RepID=A0AAD1Y1S0_EUPCR|nr:unnamed protein product [Moneuplotes crassus]
MPRVFNDESLKESSEVSNKSEINLNKSSAQGRDISYKQRNNSNEFNDFSGINTGIHNLKGAHSEASNLEISKLKDTTDQKVNKNIKMKPVISSLKQIDPKRVMSQETSPQKKRKNKVVQLKNAYCSSSQSNLRFLKTHMKNPKAYENQSQANFPKTEREAVFKRTNLGFNQKDRNRRLAKSGSWREEISSAFASQRAPVIPAIFRNKSNRSPENKPRLVEGTKTPSLKSKILRKETNSKVPQTKNSKTYTDRFSSIKEEVPKRNMGISNENFTLTDREIEIARLIGDNKKDLIKNTLEEQDNIKQLAKIMINLKEKSGQGNIAASLPERYTIEEMLNVIDTNLDSNLKSRRLHPDKEKSKKVIIPSSFAQNQDKEMFQFLMNNQPLEEEKVKVVVSDDNTKINQIENKISNIQMLHDMNTFRFFKDFSFPIEIESLKAFCKLNEKSLHTKMIKNLMVFERLFIDYEENTEKKGEPDIQTMIKYIQEGSLSKSNFCSLKNIKNIEKEYASHPEMTDDLRKHLQQKFSTKFSMNERKQMQIMKLWMNYMKEQFVEKDSNSLLNKLRNSQVIMCFSICYLCQQLAIECKEKSDILSTILELYFNIFNNYETVIESRLEARKKNIMKQEMERLEKQYKELKDNLYKEYSTPYRPSVVTNSKKKEEIPTSHIKKQERRKIPQKSPKPTEKKSSPKRKSQLYTTPLKKEDNVEEEQKDKSCNPILDETISNIKFQNESFEEQKEFLMTDSTSEASYSTICVDIPSRRCQSTGFPTYKKISMGEIESQCKTEVTEVGEPKPFADAKIQTDDVEMYKLSSNNHIFHLAQNSYLTPVEQRLIDKLNIESKKGSRQNKIISLLMKNSDYSLRVQDCHHSDKLNALLDSEYMMPIYYNNLYEKIDKMLAAGEEFRYGSEPTETINSEENEDFSEVDLDDSDEVFNSTDRYKNIPKSLLKTISSLKKSGLNLTRKDLVHKFSDKLMDGKNPSNYKKKKSNSDLEQVNLEEEKRLYEETKALLDEEIDGFEDAEELEAELPRRIHEAMANLEKRMKYLKKDEFGDPIIEDGYLEEPRGKNLQLSALRLSNLLGMLFKKNPLPEFQDEINKLMLNFSSSGEPDLDEVKNKIMTGKGLGGILGMIQKNMQKTKAVTKNMGGLNNYPPGFSPSRRKSSFVNFDKGKKGSGLADIARTLMKNKNSPGNGINFATSPGSGTGSDYYYCKNCGSKVPAKDDKEIQTDSTDISEGIKIKEPSRRKSRRGSVLDPNKIVKHLPTQQNFGDGLLSSLTKRMETKSFKNNNNQKIKTTKKQGFNFNHPSATMNFTNYEGFATPNSRDPFSFRLFNLSKSGFSGSAKGFKLPNFIFIFVQKYRQGHKSVKSVNNLSMKMMIKQMSQFYSEKVSQAKDSVNIRNATILEFVYEYLQNRYGKTPILERKVKEILLTTLKNEAKFKSIKLFAKFMGISLTSAYTNDDLSMYYILNRQFYINDAYVEANSVKREFNFNNGKMNVGRVLDQIRLYFSVKVSPKNMAKLVSEIQSKLPGHEKEGNSKSRFAQDPSSKDLYGQVIDCEDVYFACIKSYQNYKQNIVQYFLDKNLITVENDEEDSIDTGSIIEEKEELMEESFNEENKSDFLNPTPRAKKVKKPINVKDIMLDQVYSFDEFKNIFNSINKSVQFTSDSLEVIFDKYSLFKGEEKKITLESIAAIVFKFEILAI